MVSSLLDDVQMPLSGEGFESQIFLLFSEIKNHYGQDATCDGLLSFPRTQSAEPINFNTGDYGITLGASETQGMVTNLQIMCAENATATKELSATLEMGLHVPIELNVDNYILNAGVGQTSVMNSVATSDVFELEYHNWDLELSYVIKSMVDTLNLRLVQAMDLRELSPAIQKASTIFPTVSVSPKLQDGYLLLGLSFLE